jgi:hypothetical protein
MQMWQRFAASGVLALIMGAACFGQHYTQTNLVSNESGVAPVTDPQLINPWGISRGSGTPLVGLRPKDRFKHAVQRRRNQGGPNRHHSSGRPD